MEAPPYILIGSGLAGLVLLAKLKMFIRRDSRGSERTSTTKTTTVHTKKPAGQR
jgi:hypothetical protein